MSDEAFEERLLDVLDNAPYGAVVIANEKEDEITVHGGANDE